MGDKTSKALMPGMTFLPGMGKLLKKADPGRPARRAEREQSAFIDQQREEMGRQQMLEEARVAEEEDRIKRKRSRMLTGGRSLLIGTSPMGTTSELGGGGMYG